jgi:hypothetical protein
MVIHLVLVLQIHFNLTLEFQEFLVEGLVEILLLELVVHSAVCHSRVYLEEAVLV